MIDLFTAAILFCQLGTDPTYTTCDVMHSETKYSTEINCQQDVVIILKKMFQATAIAEKYYVKDIQCNNWLGIDSKNSL